MKALIIASGMALCACASIDTSQFTLDPITQRAHQDPRFSCDISLDGQCLQWRRLSFDRGAEASAAKEELDDAILEREARSGLNLPK